MARERIPRWPLIASGILLVSVGVIALLMQAANQSPTVRIPTPVMPKPNGYHNYLSACGMMRDSEKVGYAVSGWWRTLPSSPPPSPPPPASAVPPPATGSPPPGFVAPAPSYVPPHANPLERDYSLAEKEALLKSNIPALRELRKGFAYQCRRPTVRDNGGAFPELAMFRSLARVLVLEGQVREAHGDFGGAMASYLDAVEFGSDLPRGGAIIDMLVGSACQSIGRGSAWNTVDKLNGAQARSAAKRMEKELSRAVPFADTLQEEKWRTQASLMQMLKRSGWRTDFASWIAMDSAQGARGKLGMLVASKRGIVSSYTSYMDECIANAKQPYPKSKSWPKMRGNSAFQALFPVFEKARFMSVRNDAQNALLATSLALQAYRVEHGKYPASLADLAPGYLNSVPSDPCGTGPLKYRVAGQKYVLYSVGPDLRDDGGAAVNGATTAGTPSPRSLAVVEDSVGDIVAGVNP